MSVWRLKKFTDVLKCLVNVMQETKGLEGEKHGGPQENKLIPLATLGLEIVYLDGFDTRPEITHLDRNSVDFEYRIEDEECDIWFDARYEVDENIFLVFHWHDKQQEWFDDRPNSHDLRKFWLRLNPNINPQSSTIQDKKIGEN